ncbi:PREDICTED: uncharacterized protein LOC104714590 isoform X2 [Camelina sativa]|uniref:Uncharacterized protein LOC104714590 isoform X2 n=1 Tax=Camelina sativa TaxID=90675 RepID=A0ABM0TRV4_CAMSA|nr:PREDICTED: uncharacterized protein LOC104714590 isoform X2 [Camelina sativa]XP_010430314.1 PREDICTED: uncharacterized protein LOC104714590 isoform X2 [Camelina sativa]XP_010430315.1 PREDICTED: uncharacterized protein LOC104714590 isoform X2 [Camelina sativa]
MYFSGLSNDEMLYEKRFETYEESSKQNQIKMVTLFGQQVYTAKEESIVFPLRTEAYGTNLFGKKSEKVNISNGSSCLLDLNETPANEPVSNNHQYFFQDLNLPHTEETNMSDEKSGLDSVHEKDCTASPSSCCTAENNTRTHDQLQDSCELVQNAAQCLLQLSAGLLNQSHDSSFKLGLTAISSSQDHEMGVEEPSRSCDSFELHTLRIKETILEEVCCVTSKATYDLSNKKESGVKLRRGRRMKNFQKEILPELVSLSRHEIQEDINILETVLRSREYKKLQGKTKDGKCKPNPRNNKGLTQRYIGRRRRQTG